MSNARLEHSIVESVYLNGTKTVQAGVAEDRVKIRVIPLRCVGHDIEPWSAQTAPREATAILIPARPPRRFEAGLAS